MALTRPVIIIGSRENCRIRLNSSSVSKAHALLVKSGNTYYIRDLDSRTHVYIDGRRVREHALADGELVKLGSFVLKFVAPAQATGVQPAGAQPAGAQPAADLDAPSKVDPILPASLVPATGEMPVPIEERALLIGRRPGADVRLLEESASTSHAVVFEMDGQHYIRDLGSRTGTFINGVKIHQHCLNGEDVIRIGETNLRYKSSPEADEFDQPAEEPLEEPLAEARVEAAPEVDTASIAPPTALPVEDDFGLEILPELQPAAEAPVDVPEKVRDKVGDRAVAEIAAPEPAPGLAPESVPGPEVAEEDAAQDESGQILPGRRGWRAVVPEESSPALAPTAEAHSVEEKPLASEEPELDLSSFAQAEKTSSADVDPGVDHGVDFDERSLVNQDAGRSDVVDFDFDLSAPGGPPPAQDPLFSSAGVADIAAAERAQAQKEEDARREAQERADAEAREEQERRNAERAAAEKAEADRLAAEKAEAERLAAEEAEAHRIAAEQAEAARLEAERVEAERAAAEAARIAAERAEAERLEAERVAAEKAEADRLEAARVEAERLAAEEAARVAAEQAEAARLEAERLAAEKAEAERLAAAKAHQERIEAERLAAEQAEAQRVAAEKAELERLEAERVAAEAARIAAEVAEAARLEAERVAAEQAEAERVAAEKAEQERLAAERLAAEKAEADRIAAERAEAARIEAERIAAEKAEAERIEAERIAAEKAEVERLAFEKAEYARIEAEQAEAERAEAQRIEAERLEAERLAAEKTEADRIEAEQKEAELAYALKRIEAERIAAERAEAERLIAECLAGEETIEATEPTPESAFELGLMEDTSQTGSAVSDASVMPYFDAAITASLTDSTFGRAIEDFTGSQSGVLVEPPTGSDAEPTSQTPPALIDEHAPGLSLPGEPFGEQSDGEFFDQFVEPVGDLDHSKLVSKLGEEKLGEETGVQAEAMRFDEASLVDDWEPLPTPEPSSSPTASAESSPPASADLAADLSSPASPVPASAPTKPLFPAQMQLGGSFDTWGGNLSNYLGGQPLATGNATVNLPPPPPPPQLARPPQTIQPQQPVARFESPVPPAPSQDAADAEIDSVSALIDEILVGEAHPRPSVKTPFSQTAAPLPSDPTAREPFPPTQSGGAAGKIGAGLALGLEAGTAAAGMGAGGTAAGAAGKLAAEITAEMAELGALPAIPLPRLLRRPLRRGIADMKSPLQKAAVPIDELIPPFGTPLPELANRRKSEEPDPMESLAKPPVKETDVFAHTSPPALEEESVSDEETPFVEDPLAPQGYGAFASATTPMDMVFDETSGSRHLSRRVRGGGRMPPPQRLGGPTPAGMSQPAIGRVDLPNDPFWSGAGGGGAESANVVGDGGANGGELPPIAAMANLLPPRGRQPVRPSLPAAKPFRQIKPVRSRMPNFEFAAAQDHNAILAERRRRLLRVPLLVLLGTALLAADLLGIWKLMPPKSIVDATVTFDHLADLDQLSRNTFIDGQKQKLAKDDGIRHLALSELSKQNPEIAPGFLDDATEYENVVNAASWPDRNNSTMVISRATADVNGDIPRMKAIGLAIYDSNGVLIDEAQRNQSNLAEAQAAVDNDTKINEALQKQREEAMAIADGRPSEEMIAQLQADQDRLKKALDDAMLAKSNAQAELQRLQQQIPVNGDDAATQPASSPGLSGVADDDQVKQLQSQMDAVKAQVDAAKAQRVKDAQAAQAALDASLAQFQQQVADAKTLSKDNPQLTAYVAAAQKFQETTRGLVDELMRRQQQQYAQLTELQARLNEKMEERREQMWQKDETLQRMNDALEYAKRQLNAALGTGQQKEADDLKAEIALRETTIKAREDMTPVDPLYADAVESVQKIIDQQQKSMQEDRETTTKALDEAQQEFANSQPTMDSLPAEQKSLATEMDKQLADINAARAKYAAAASAVGAGGDEATKKLEDQESALAASISMHRKQLDQVDVQKAIADKQAQLAKLTQAANDAQAAYTAKASDLQLAQTSLKTALAAGQHLQELNDKQEAIEQQLKQLTDDLKFKQEAARESVQPLLITDADIHQRSGEDKRPTYAVYTGVPIFAVFAGLICLTVYSASRELPLNALSPSEPLADGSPEPFSLPSPLNGGNGSNGNGGFNGHGSDGPSDDGGGQSNGGLSSLSGSVGGSMGGSLDEGDIGEAEEDVEPEDAISNN